MMELPEIFFEVHTGLPREGPGGDEHTERAYGMISAPANPRILDIGCGPGMQTIKLARLSKGHITAIDTHQPFLEQLKAKIAAENPPGRIEPVNMSMFDITFPDESFDILWAEGSIFIIGLKKGLEDWRRLLKPGGWLAFTESAWIKPDPPAEVRKFWNSCYPAIDTVDSYIDKITACGYEVAGHFILPPSAWWDNYYIHIEQKLPLLREKHAGEPAADLEYLDFEQLELDTFKKYNVWYSYVFFVLRKK